VVKVIICKFILNCTELKALLQDSGYVFSFQYVTHIVKLSDLYQWSKTLSFIILMFIESHMPCACHTSRKTHSINYISSSSVIWL